VEVAGTLRRYFFSQEHKGQLLANISRRSW